MRPFPYPNPIDAVNLVVKVAKKAYELVNNWIEKRIKEAGNNKPLTADSSTADFQSIQVLLTQISSDIQASSKELEQKISLEVDEYFAQLKFILSSNNSLLNKYELQFSKFEREVRRIKKQCIGFIGNEVSKNLNLLNPELKEILMMLPGQKKEEAIKHFIQDSLTHAVSNFTDFFQDEVTYLIEMVEENLVAQLERVKSQANQVITNLNELESTDLQDIENKERQLVRSLLIIHSINQVDDVLLDTEE
ncbi:hypothetical protein [Niallia sp. MER TA 168]|uniref:hypothetical protein n=1 Tax=Niallia sp. MER TA 168 TaxID=2939568 RepID=UPI002040EA91|nr:hypothetical protein [Niallia sp. MER TA 168]MCM3360358.1 hypothetical protein [Niallia sp. MER TA 168]